MIREISVIVVGVSIALGADALYGRHQDGLERERILQSFRADLRLDSVQFAAAVGASQDPLARLLGFVDNPSEPNDPIVVAAALRESILWPSGLKESATYREVTATGRLSLIQNEKLRESLLRYYARSFTGLPPELWATYHSDVHGAYEQTLRRHLGSGFLELVRCGTRSDDYEMCLRPPSARIDFDVLRADPEFVQGLVAMALWAGRFENLIRRQDELHGILVEQLDAAIVGR